VEPRSPSRVDTLPDGFSELLRKRELSIGSTIGERYRLTALLGDGAMGQVLIAENIAIGAQVAVKVLRPELLANQEFRRRFQQEAEAMASVEHPNVARFLDLVIGDPTFFVMEYVRGPNLAETLAREKRLDRRRAVHIATRICWGLDAAHAVGVIHRDLKPANLVLAPDREHGEMPKVIDFGLAKLAANTSANQLTRSGQIVGTPHYMAPEQIEGREVDPRTDVYSLGCVLYEMLTGRTPFADVHEDVQVLYRQLHERPLPPSAYAPDVPPELDAIVLRALDKSPVARFGSMQELARALESTAQPGSRPYLPPPPPPPAEPSTTLTTLPLPPRQRRLVLGVSVAIAATIGMILGTVITRRVDRSRGAAGAAAVSAGPPHPGATRAALMVITDPASAHVDLDGQALDDRTPLMVDDLDAGEHRLRVRLDGYMEVERSFKLKEGERRVAQLTLQAGMRAVRVRTVPPGALIYVDDRLNAASSPANIQITQDDFHEVRAEKLGFEPAIVHIAPDDRAGEVTLTMEVEKLPRGYVLIDCEQEAAVWIDGAETGFETPTLGIRVQSGEHSIQLVDGSGRKSPVVKVHVHQGETVRVRMSIEEGKR
jgi:tRNA A-37 threonylcarbamoyl transferase component Bud32